jgi:hypothetical protein
MCEFCIAALRVQQANGIETFEIACMIPPIETAAVQAR